MVGVFAVTAKTMGSMQLRSSQQKHTIAEII